MVLFYQTFSQLSIWETAVWRMSGSLAFSSGVNLLRTKSISEILPIVERSTFLALFSEASFSAAVARLEPTRAALSVPSLRRAKSSVLRRAMVDLRPLLPPAEPD